MSDRVRSGTKAHVYRLDLTADEVLILGAVAALGSDVLVVGQAGEGAVLAVTRFVQEIAAVADRPGTANRLAVKLDPLVAAAKAARKADA
jgi:hypothetical protein